MAEKFGGHTFNHNAVMYGLDHFVEPEIAKANPNLTPEQVHRKARSIMAKSIWENHRFNAQEEKREQPEIKLWEIVENDGVKELRSAWGEIHQTLHETWDHMY